MTDRRLPAEVQSERLQRSEREPELLPASVTFLRSLRACSIGPPPAASSQPSLRIGVDLPALGEVVKARPLIGGSRAMPEDRESHTRSYQGSLRMSTLCSILPFMNMNCRHRAAIYMGGPHPPVFCKRMHRRVCEPPDVEVAARYPQNNSRYARRQPPREVALFSLPPWGDWPGGGGCESKFNFQDDAVQPV